MNAKSMQRILYILGIVFACAVSGWTQTSLEGKVTDQETGEALIGCNIALYRNGVLVTGTDTDIDGNYTLSNIDPGTYDVEVSYVGYQTQRQTGVVVFSGKSNKLDIGISQGLVLDQVVVIEYKVPLIEQDNTTSGGIVTAEKIRNLPMKNINQLAATAAGISSIDGGAIAVRGSRTNATDYYIDGIRVTGSLLPQTEIDQLQVITGGIEAKYGDVTGGIIAITTKGPSNQFSGGLEVESSQYLDPYGYNLVNMNLSGPILRKKSGQSILGYRLAGQYRGRKVDDPPAYGVYRVDPDRIRSLEENPLSSYEGITVSSGELLQNDDAKLLKAIPNEGSERLDLTGKIDAQISRNIDVTLSGNYNTSKNQFTPGGWGLLDYENNPFFYSSGYRANFRLRHRLGRQSLDDNQPQQGFIRNASYTFQLGYEKSFTHDEDQRHKNNLFRYGYIGSYDVNWIPVEGESPYSRGPLPGIAHAGYLQVLEGYTPGSYNPVLANYNLNTSPSSIEGYNAYNGFWSSNYNSIWRIHSNVGAVYNRVSKSENDTYTLNLGTSFDLFPGGSDKGRHNIQFGLVYEQRLNRSWAVAPFGLWTIARLQANNQIIGVDTTTVIGTFKGVFSDLSYEQFQTLVDEDPNLLFYKKVRDLTGQSVHDYVNVDALNPDDLSLDMFSVQELTDQGVIDYFGYDYLGNKIGNNVTFNDFFTSVYPDGRRQFLVAPNQPIYGAFYLQDKFTYRDIIFRVGLRVDRYDANTKVLKDPFSLYEIMNASDFYASTGQARPAPVEDDFKVYVDGDNSNKVVAFRRDEQWYYPNGTAANDGNLIFGGEIVHPKYVDPEADIKSRDFDPNTSFTDYTPQVNWMPRLAFSFPISDVANFFAHYDILVQRPPSNTLTTALDYYYFEDAGRTPSNNPALRPERTIDYEVGFQQKLSQSSALKISVYYKELRDMIQTRTYLYIPAPVNTYTGYGNLDFGTVKGFSFQYDLRRTANLEMTANYTLQFADGTGSNANSQRGLTTRGNIRTLLPLSFDERHRFVTTLDYRYGSGKLYNGPIWFGADVLANFGVNLTATAVSGRPYTKLTRAQPFGGTGYQGAINGARLPWNYTFDMRVDKSFLLGKENSKRPTYLNVYFRVENLLDTRNVIGVYPVTGSPDDDGYLTSSDGKSALNTISTSGRDVDAYLASYQWALLNPDLYSLPRRMYLGAILEF